MRDVSLEAQKWGKTKESYENSGLDSVLKFFDNRNKLTSGGAASIDKKIPD